MRDARTFGLQFRLKDRHGDEGMIAVVIGVQAGAEAFIDTWLMSCRVIGRQVEAATLGVLASVARSRGVARLVGEYLPTARNAMVKDHYPRLGFEVRDVQADGSCRYVLDLGRPVRDGSCVTPRQG